MNTYLEKMLVGNTHQWCTGCLCDAYRSMSWGPCVGLLTSVSDFSWKLTQVGQDWEQCYQRNNLMVSITLLHMWVGPWPLMSITIILPNQCFCPWSGQLLNSSRNTCTGNCCETDNNPLTYILSTPNLDATQNHWVELLTEFTFSIECQKGGSNSVADALSHVMSKLDAEVVKSILDGVTIGSIGRADAHELVVAETGERIHKQAEEIAVQVRATHTCINLHVMDWVAAHKEHHAQNCDGVDLHP